jgi:hypothetical protein
MPDTAPVTIPTLAFGHRSNQLVSSSTVAQRC